VEMAYLKVGHHTVIPLAQLRMLVPGLEPGIWHTPLPTCKEYFRTPLN